MFTEQYFRKRKYLAWRAPIICAAIKKVFSPTSVIDFGCSIGDLVKGFNDLGVVSIGVDSAPALFEWSHPETPILLHDITEPLPTLSRFDLALCIETIRFIPEEKLGSLIHNFRSRSSRVLLGYAGDRKSYVIKAMQCCGYILTSDCIQPLKRELEMWKTKPAIKALYHGGMYFVPE